MQLSTHRRFLLTVVLAVVVVTSTTPALTTAESHEDPTFVESDVTGDTTWTAEEGPYRVIQDIDVDSEATLTIEAGTDVQFAEDIDITVRGSLEAAGTEDRPISLERTRGASASARWTGIRYAGEHDSRLLLTDTSLSGAHDGVIVESEAGEISIRDSTITDIGGDGVTVEDVTQTPAMRITNAAFRHVDGHGIAATPAAGTVDELSLTAKNSSPSAQTTHELSYVPGVEVTFNEFTFDYGSHGNVSTVDEDAISRFGLDTDGDGDVDRSLKAHVDGVNGTDSRQTVQLAKEVTVDSDDDLLLTVTGVQNPATNGIYPVDITLSAGGIPQHSDGVDAPLVIGSVTTTYADTTVDKRTRVSDLTVRDTTFTSVGETGIFVDADRASKISVTGTTIRGVGGDAIGLRAKHLYYDLWNSDLSATDTGLDVAVRDAAGMTIAGNTIHDSATGISIRQSSPKPRGTIRLDARYNRLSDNHNFGLRSDAATAVLTDFSIQNTTIARNGRGGAALSQWAIQRGQIADNTIVGNGGSGLALTGRDVERTRMVRNTIRDNADDGILVDARFSARDIAIHDSTVQDNDGHGVAVVTGLVSHEVNLSNSRLANNAGAGVLVESPLTHGGSVRVTNNVIAANTYGVHLAGALRSTVRENDIVYNTNAYVSPKRIDGIPPGTGVSVTEGSAGVVLDRGTVKPELAELVADPQINAQLVNTVGASDTAVVLRTDRAGHARIREEAALSIEAVSTELPTGVALAQSGDTTGVTLTRNDIYGQQRGLLVDTAPLVDANTSAQLLTDGIRTVSAEDTFWGSSSGPYHDSILPSGEGATIETRRGWVDFIPFANDAYGTEYTRPAPDLVAPDTATKNAVVTVSARANPGSENRILKYHFDVAGTPYAPQTDPELQFSMPNHSVTVQLGVENALGIDNATTAAKTVNVEETTTESHATTTPTAPSSPTSEPTDRGSSRLVTIVRLLGGGLYLTALLLSGYGLWLSRNGRIVPFEAMHVHGLVVAATGVWALGGLVGGSGLLPLAVSGAVGWGILSATVYFLAR